MSRRKLLLADDSVTIQKVVNLTFADEGVDVVTVGDGDSAMERIADDKPDVILADVNMPGLTGYQICERLRADEATRDIPVILLVGSFEPFDEGEATRVGANAHLTKPFQSIRQLVAQVTELMNASPAVSTNGAEPASDSTSGPQLEREESPEQQQPSQFAEAQPVVEPVVEGESEPQLEPEESPEQAQARQFDDLGYETFGQPVVTTTETKPDDIEHLYSRSIDESGSDAELSDVGIDDEMIETSYTAAEANSDLGSLERESQSAGLSSPDTWSEPQELESPVEAQYSEPGLETFGSRADEITEAEPPSEPKVETQGFQSSFADSQYEDVSKFEQTIAFNDWQPADMREPEAEEAAPETHEHLVSAASTSGAYSQDRPAIGEETIRMENRFDTTGSPFQFNDVDLLDLASPGEAKTVEITSPVNAIEQGSDKQVVTLSPELIEVIAQRVIEKMSEKY